MLGFFFGTPVGAAAFVQLDLWCVMLAIAIVGALSVWAVAIGRRITTTGTIAGH
jgi:hypothetical protein